MRWRAQSPRVTLARSHEGFKAWCVAFENGSDEFDLHLAYMHELDIPKEEAFFILTYAGTHSSWINSDLRNGEELSSRCKQAFSESLEQVLRKLTSFNNQIVYRMDIPPDDDEESRSWFDQHVGAKFEILIIFQLRRRITIIRPSYGKSRHWLPIVLARIFPTYE